MKLYENYVNYSVFDGEITLDSSARDHLLSTVFLNNPANRDNTDGKILYEMQKDFCLIPKLVKR